MYMRPLYTHPRTHAPSNAFYLQRLLRCAARTTLSMNASAQRCASRRAKRAPPPPPDRSGLGFQATVPIIRVACERMCGGVLLVCVCVRLCASVL